MQHGLQQGLGLALDLDLARGEDGIDLGIADDLAHGRLGRAFDRLVGPFHGKKVLHRIADLILHDKLHVHDVFVPREHEGFLVDGRVLQRGTIPAVGGTEPHFHAPNLRHFRGLYGLEGKR